MRYKEYREELKKKENPEKKLDRGARRRNFQKQLSTRNRQELKYRDREMDRRKHRK